MLKNKTFNIFLCKIVSQPFVANDAGAVTKYYFYEEHIVLRDAQAQNSSQRYSGVADAVTTLETLFYTFIFVIHPLHSLTRVVNDFPFNQLRTCFVFFPLTPCTFAR